MSFTDQASAVGANSSGTIANKGSVSLCIGWPTLVHMPFRKRAPSHATGTDSRVNAPAAPNTHAATAMI